jgi:hypothetical protein
MGHAICEYCAAHGHQLGVNVKISLGVIDMPYADGKTTTGDVAEILEGKFHVMEIFADQNIEFMAQAISDGLIGSMENAFAGAPESANVFASAMAEIEDRFQQFIDREESGIHTKAKDQPKAGPRKKRQYRQVEAKTTFVETGSYRDSFRAWITDSSYG